MKIPTKILSEALKKLKIICNATKTHPIYGNVALIFDKKTLRLIGADAEKRMELVMPCKSKEAASLTVNCAYLSDLLATRSEEDCDIAIKDGTCFIQVGKHSGRRPGLPVEDMEQWPATGTGLSFSIPGKLLAESLAKCLTHAGQLDGERAYLNSVMIASREGQLLIQATDGRRALICTTVVPFDFGNDVAFIPRDSVPSLIGICDDADIEVTIADNILTATSETSTFRTKLIEAKARSLFGLMPKNPESKIVCSREELLTELRSCAGYCDEPPKVVLSFDGAEISIKATNATRATETGEGSGSVVATGNAVDMCIDPVYLSNALKQFEESEISIQYQDNQEPVFIKNDNQVAIIALQKLP